MKQTARREHRLAVTRDSILDAASGVFARQGFQSATMKDIADEAGYSAPSLYTYFESKHEIVAALIERMARDILALFDAPSIRGLTFRQRLEQLTQRLYEHADRNHALFSMLTSAHGTGDGATALAVQQLETVQTQLERMTRWFRDSSTAVERNHRDPEDLAFLFWSMSSAFHFRPLLLGKQGPPLSKQVDAVLEVFFHGALGPKRAREARS